MKRLSGKSLGIVIAVLVVGGLAVYAAVAGQHGVPASAGLPPMTNGATPAAPATGAAVPGLSGGDLISLVLKVGIVALLLGGSLWLLRRYAGSAARAGGRTGAIQIVDTISLAQNRAFYVLDIGDRAVVVGATPQQFSMLAEITDEDALTRLRARPERLDSPFAGLSKQIGAMLHRGEPPSAADTPAKRPARDGAPQPPATTPKLRRATAQSANFAQMLAAVKNADPANAPIAGETTDRLRALTERLSTQQEPAQ